MTDVNVELFVVVGVALGDGVRTGSNYVTMSMVCKISSNGYPDQGRCSWQRWSQDHGQRMAIQRLEQGAEKLGSGLDVCGPSEPSGMTGVEVHVDANRVELLDSVCNCGLKEFSKDKR